MAGASGGRGKLADKELAQATGGARGAQAQPAPSGDDDDDPGGGGVEPMITNPMKKP